MGRHVLLVFIDGVGLGPPTPANPLAVQQRDLQRLTGGRRWVLGEAPGTMPHGLVRVIDATLGVEGLPQSGTGQAALFTGVNAPELAGRHYGPYPHSATRPAIKQHNIFARIKRRYADEPEPVAFANAYPDRFFTYARRRDWWTVTTRCCLDADVRIRDAAALVRGQALAADITGRGWPQNEPRVEAVSEAEAAHRLLDINRQHRFTLFEYYLTDKAGHGRDPERATSVLASLGRMLAALYEALDVERETLVITSDHGNLEDLSTKSHTLNPVPLIACGASAAAFSQVNDLTDVVPALVTACTGT